MPHKGYFCYWICSFGQKSIVPWSKKYFLKKALHMVGSKMLLNSILVFKFIFVAILNILLNRRRESLLPKRIIHWKSKSHRTIWWGNVRTQEYMRTEIMIQQTKVQQQNPIKYMSTDALKQTTHGEYCHWHSCVSLASFSGYFWHLGK